jgi:hypothetical protein
MRANGICTGEADDDADDERPVEHRALITLPKLTWMSRRPSVFWDSPPQSFAAELARRRREAAGLRSPGALTGRSDVNEPPDF